MNRIPALVCMVAGLGFAGGCAKPAYVVAPTHEETLREKLDAEWFTRKIYDGNGLAAVELTYCPIQPKTRVVCRTGIVWIRDNSFFMDLEPQAAQTPSEPSMTPPPAPPAQ
jgi:hypothetical protein